MKQTLSLMLGLAMVAVGNPVSMFASPAAFAGWQSTQASADAVLVAAKTVAIVGETGEELKWRGWASPDGERGRQKVEAVLRKWERYEIVADPRDADLVLAVYETQKNLSFMRIANLVAELKVYAGHQEDWKLTPVLWSTEAAENFAKLPATVAAQRFQDYVRTLDRAHAGR